MLELLLWVSLGIILGSVAGLFPGIHPNTLLSLFLALFVGMGIEPIYLASFLISMGVVNSFVTYIPAVFLGAPDGGDDALSVLPGHRMLMEGRGYEAVKLTVIGGLGSTILGVLTLPLFAVAIPFLYTFLRPAIQWILIFIVSYMIFSEKGKTKIAFAVLTFGLAGIMGILVLNGPNSEQMLFPMLSGLFGLPMLLLAIKNKTSLPERIEFESDRMEKKHILEGLSIGTFSGILVGLLPGVGSAQATVLAQEVSTKTTPSAEIRRFMIATGGVNTANLIYSILALYLISNGRSGIAVAVGNLVEITLQSVYVFIAIIITASGIGAYLTIKLSRWFVFKIRKIDYNRLTLSVFVLIWILVAGLTGPIGLLVCFVSLTIGMIANLSGVKKSHGMSCLLTPTILFFMGMI